MRRHIDNIIDPSSNPIVAIPISTSSISSELRFVHQSAKYLSPNKRETHIVIHVRIEIRCHVSRMSPPNRPCHAWPRYLHGQDPFDVWPGLLHTGRGI